jgi:hypothetical protein
MVKKFPKKHYSLAQANRILPLVKKSLLRMMRLDNSLNTLSCIEITYDDPYQGLVYDVQYDRKFHQLSYAFYREFEKLIALGAVLKCLDAGEIDFFSRFEAREIFLCWKIGEHQISHWHEVEDDFEGRKKISEFKKGAKIK